MKAASLAFRFRVLIFIFLYVLGFWAPWERLSGSGNSTVWLAASTLAARAGWLGLANATVTVTLIALASLTAGAMLRVWGTAYLGSTTMRGAAMQGATIVAAGPYRYLRNPLYLGSWLVALGTSVLMPPTGALFFLVTFTAFSLSLIRGEETFLTATAGAAYRQYCFEVPRLLPRFTVIAAGGPADRPRWLQALMAETYPVAFTLCFAVFAWRYNAHILIKCLLICYGVSLVVRAVSKETSPVSDEL
jgi:protein-S-isoprenylcysteine O-methyltransferase Ste14